MVGMLIFLRHISQKVAVAAAGDEGKRWRAGDVAGLGEDGRISMAKVSSMVTSSLHVEVGLSSFFFWPHPCCCTVVVKLFTTILLF